MLPTTFKQIQKKRRKWPHAHKQTFKHLSPKMRMFGTMLFKTDLSTWRSCLYLFKYSHLGQDQTRRATLVKLLECTLMKMSNSFYIKNFVIKIKHMFSIVIIRKLPGVLTISGISVSGFISMKLLALFQRSKSLGDRWYRQIYIFQLNYNMISLKYVYLSISSSCPSSP